jgi:hypothetical protein
MPVQFTFHKTPIGNVQEIGKLPGTVVRVGRWFVDVAKTFAYRPFRTPVAINGTGCPPPPKYGGQGVVSKVLIGRGRRSLKVLSFSANGTKSG